MRLAVGTRLGPDEILAAPGALSDPYRCVWRLLGDCGREAVSDPDAARGRLDTAVDRRAQLARDAEKLTSQWTHGADSDSRASAVPRVFPRYFGCTNFESIQSLPFKDSKLFSTRLSIRIWRRVIIPGSSGKPKRLERARARIKLNAHEIS